MFGPSGLPARMPTVGRVQQNTKTVLVPAPNGGINAVDMLAAMQPIDAILAYNMIPDQYGCRVRTGLSLWGQRIGTGGVNTILPYNGSTSLNDKMFAAGKNGIFDITSSGANNPAALITFGVTGVQSGYGGWVAVATLSGNYLLYCDELNGYYVYTEGSGWAKVTLGGGATQVSGVDPATFVWCVQFKERVWFVQKNTASAWYLPTGAVFGAATQFNFGNKFRHGGSLVALYTWTLDGGNGIDDYLVAISSSGDIVIYQGSDPSVATSFSVVGQWNIGPPPAYRRLAGSFGGDLYIVTSYGVLPLSKLIAGMLIQDQAAYVSRKVSPLINNVMTASRTQVGWEIKLVPDQHLLIVSTPKLAASSYIQFVQNLNNQGWGLYRDLPYNTGDSWNGSFYIGDSSGNVWWHTGNNDNSLAINWSLVTSYQEYQEVGNYHKAEFIRPVFITSASPTYSVQAHYDYDLTEVLTPTAPGLLAGSLWDVALWDTALWTGALSTSAAVNGASGIGRAMAVGIAGSSLAETQLIRFDLMFQTGNYL